MNNRWLRGALAVAASLGLALPSAARAQEEAEGGDLAQVIVFQVEPAQAQAFEEAVAQIVEAAELAELSKDYEWYFWNDIYEYVLVFPIANMAYFDDTDQWMRAFAGTPGEETLNAAFTALGPIEAKTVRNEIVESDPSISYMPAAGWPENVRFAHVDMVWVKDGHEDDFTAIAKEYMTLFAQLELPYPTMGHRIKIGDSDRVDFVTFYDSKGDFYGKNDLMAIVEASGMGEKWGEMGSRLNQYVTDWKHQDFRAMPAMTYEPEAETGE